MLTHRHELQDVFTLNSMKNFKFVLDILEIAKIATTIIISLNVNSLLYSFITDTHIQIALSIMLFIRLLLELTLKTPSAQW